MNIIFTTGSAIKDADGVSRCVHEIIDRFLSRGHKILCLSQSVISMQDVKQKWVKVPSFFFPFFTGARASCCVNKIVKKEFDAFNPDIIHIHTLDFLGISAIRYANNHNIPVFSTHHTRFDVYSTYCHLSFLVPVIWFISRKFYRRCQFVFCPSSQVAKELNDHGIINTIVLPWGVDTGIFNVSKFSEEFRNKHNLKNKIVLLFVGRLSWEKNLKTFIEIYNELKLRSDISFVFAGDGPIKKQLQKAMPKGIFLGKIDTLDLAKVFASCDIFVYPSFSETFGMVIIEAMASGLPIVAANDFGTLDIVTNNKYGFLCNPKDVQEFVQNILYLIENKDARAIMSKNVLQRAKEFSWEISIEKELEVYRNQLSNK